MGFLSMNQTNRYTTEQIFIKNEHFVTPLEPTQSVTRFSWMFGHFVDNHNHSSRIIHTRLRTCVTNKFNWISLTLLSHPHFWFLWISSYFPICESNLWVRRTIFSLYACVHFLLQSKECWTQHESWYIKI